MNTRTVRRVLGAISIVIGIAMLPPALLSFGVHTGHTWAFLVTALIALVLGLAGLATSRGEMVMKTRDGFAIVTFGWIGAALLGAVPYVLAGVCGPVDAIFESMSGFTTTGSSVIADVESLPAGILLWRSETQWIGGLGIVVLSIAVLPLLGVGGMQLFKAEMPGPTTDRMYPRIRTAATTLWGVYVGLTLLEVVFLLFGGMGLLDAVCHAFCTVSTGGFSTRNASVGSFHSNYIETVIAVFMFLSGINFALYLSLLRRRAKRALHDEEIRLYVVLAVVSIAFLSWTLIAHSGFTWTGATHQAAFQVVSILTTTGFGTSDFHVWSEDAQLVLFCLMFLGACAGSTSGGIKLIRIIVLAKHSLSLATKQLHPRAVQKIRFSGSVVPEEVILKVLGFFMLYIFFFLSVALIVSAMGVDIDTALGASIATLSNIGPGIGEVGPASTYAAIPSAAKILLAFNMLLGRLELYTVLIILTPIFWRRP